MNKIIYKNNAWHFDSYFQYLKENESLIPKNIIRFVTDQKRYSLGKDSLHDSRLKYFNFSFSDKSKEDKLVIKFLAPYFDKVYEVEFQNVSFIKFNSKIKKFKNIDLLVHEFNILGNGLFSYEFIFDGKEKIKIEFEKLKIKTISIKP